MPDLQNLPLDVIITIFCNLSDFDDISHIKQSCKEFHSILRVEKTYLNIMRSIIWNSDVYEFDIEMCKLIEANEAFSQVYRTHTECPLEMRMKGPETFSITDIRPGDLTEERIYAILCRWQGLRVLQDLYLDPMIHTKYLNSIFPYVEHDRSTDITLLMESAARILHLQTSSVKNQPGISFSAQQTRRFYKALNSYWLAMEWVWLWSRSIHDTWQENWKMKDMIDNIWRGYHCRSLLESFELIEVHDFVYGFLLRIIFPDFEAMLPWIGENLTIFLADEPDRSIGYDYFVACSRLFLRPPDIIELLIKGGSITKAKNVEYLQLRGAFEITGGVELIKHPARVSLDPWFDVRTLQNGVCRHIKDIGDNTEATRNLLKLWKLFRENWKQDARWTLFWWAGSSDDILVRLESRKPIA